MIDIILLCRDGCIPWVYVGEMKLHWFRKMTRRMLKTWNPSRFRIPEQSPKENLCLFPPSGETILNIGSAAVYSQHLHHSHPPHQFYNSWSMSSSMSALSEPPISQLLVHSTPFSTWEKFCPLLLLFLLLFLLKIIITSNDVWGLLYDHHHRHYHCPHYLQRLAHGPTILNCCSILNLGKVLPSSPWLQDCPAFLTILIIFFSHSCPPNCLNVLNSELSYRSHPFLLPLRPTAQYRTLWYQIVPLIWTIPQFLSS